MKEQKVNKLYRSIYKRLNPAEKEIIEELNFLAEETTSDFIIEQFYLAIELICQQIQKLHPEIECPSGCSRCCQELSFPQLYYAEWELIKQALDKMSSDIKEKVRNNVISLPPKLFSEEGSPLLSLDKYQSIVCPLLINGKCSVYAFRPLACRMIGYFFTKRYQQNMFGQQEIILPLTCQQESQRIQQSSNGKDSYKYMFMPLDLNFREILGKIDLKKSPLRLLLLYLEEYFEKK